MNQFISSWRFVFKNFKNLISFGVPWLTFTIISIGFISKRMPQILIDENIAPNEAVVELIEALSMFYENNVNQLFIIELMINVFFLVFIASLAVQFKNISNSINPQSFFGISRIIYAKIPYLFIASFLTGIVVQIGFLFLIFPGIYLFARLSLYPIYISLETKEPIESIKCSWNAADEFGTKLTIYTLIVGILLILTILITSSLLALSSIGAMFIVPIILFEIIIFSMVLSFIYFSLYKYLEK